MGDAPAIHRDAEADCVEDGSVFLVTVPQVGDELFDFFRGHMISREVTKSRLYMLFDAVIGAWTNVVFLNVSFEVVSDQIG